MFQYLLVYSIEYVIINSSEANHIGVHSSSAIGLTLCKQNIAQLYLANNPTPLKQWPSAYSYTVLQKKTGLSQKRDQPILVVIGSQNKNLGSIRMREIF